jgi:phosphatidate cytidylyltransferase
MNANNQGAVLLRILTALVALAGTLVLVWVPVLRPGFVLFVALLAAYGMREYYTMARKRDLNPAQNGSLVIGVLIVLSALLWNPTDYPLCPELALISAFIVCIFLHLFNDNHCLPGMGASFFGVIYAGWFPAHIVWLHGYPTIGPGLLMILMIVLTLSDSGAYFVGSVMGRHKLAPKVSPNKTWEGAVGGVVMAGIGLMILAKLQEHFHWTAFPEWSPMFYVMLAIALSVVGQIGDLFESMLKRDAGIKDSGDFFPGHGGVLDRCDGYLLAGPVLYYITFLTLS